MRATKRVIKEIREGRVIDKLKTPYIQWGKVLGSSLRKWLFSQFDAGNSPDRALSNLLVRVKDHQDREIGAGRVNLIPRGGIINKAKISVSARWSEYNRGKRERWWENKDLYGDEYESRWEPGYDSLLDWIKGCGCHQCRCNKEHRKLQELQMEWPFWRMAIKEMESNG